MRSAHYFLATALPALGAPGSAPPMTLADLRAAVADSSAAPLVEAILLGDDIRQRQAVLAGELSEAAPAVLDAAQLQGRAPLPAVLDYDDPADPNRQAAYLLWEAYWQHVARVAHRRGSAFLAGWLGMEIALRNGIAAARARSFNQPASAHVVAPELGRDEHLIELAVAGWAGAPDPLAGLRSLLRARWDWVAREEPSFSFSDDELAAYAVKLILLRDWRRTMEVAA